MGGPIPSSPLALTLDTFDKCWECTDASFEVLDVADFRLPLLDEPLPPSRGRYTHEHTRIWSQAVEAYDGYVFVTGEYNHSIPGALKNALDFRTRSGTTRLQGSSATAAAAECAPSNISDPSPQNCGWRRAGPGPSAVDHRIRELCHIPAVSSRRAEAPDAVRSGNRLGRRAQGPAPPEAAAGSAACTPAEGKASRRRSQANWSTKVVSLRAYLYYGSNASSGLFGKVMCWKGSGGCGPSSSLSRSGQRPYFRGQEGFHGAVG